MTTQTLYRRIRRRETHSSRAVPAIVFAVLAIIALCWLVAEIVLAAAGRPKLLLSPRDIVAGVEDLPTVAPALLTTAGVVLAAVGLVLLALAVRPGRLGRHTIADDRAVVVVHDEVVASALVRTVADASSTDPDQAVASVGRRRAQVRVTPSSGVAVDRPAVLQALSARLDALRLHPPITGRLTVDAKGRVGA